MIANQLDDDGMDAITQAGTNLSSVNFFSTLEKQLGKPIIPISIATNWHAFRATGIKDQIMGKGWLFERY